LDASGIYGAFLGGNPSTLSADSIKALPDTARLVLYDVEHEIDLVACRARMVYRIAELMATGATGSGRTVIAEAAGVDVQTFRKFLEGGHVTPENLISIIERGLGLKFADVVKPAKGVA